MKRATTLKVLAGTLVLTLLATSLPLALVALKASEDERAALAEGLPSEEGETPRVVDLPFPLPGEGVTLPPSSVTDATNGLGGPSSRPGASGATQDRADASGSVLLSQVLGAAKLMGHDDVPVPDLPYAIIPTEAPLRAAIVAWVASTGSVVPPDELAAQLLRADALPIEIQRDLALLLFSAVAASELQRAALANIPANDLAWIYAHPEVAEQLSDGISNEDTLRMATLASMIDMEKTIAASLLMLQAVEVTRGSLANAKAAETLDLIEGADLDPTTRAMLELLVSANERVTDSAKLQLAAEIVTLGAGIRVPEAPQAPTFEEALRALLETSQMVPDAALLDETLARANALPLDLQTALAQIILAEANAIKAADPATMTPTSQTEALAAMLVAVGDALPTLEKYNLYWTSAPDALRVTEWDPAARLGWVAHHAALVLTSANDISSLSAAAAIASGHALPASATVPERGFVDAYLAIAKEGGFKVSETQIDDLRKAEAALSPAVRDAAALLMSAAAESARLQAIAFRDVSPIEREFLVQATDGLDALYGAPLSDADRARLAAATAIAARVDADALTAASIVAAQAATEALRILEGADAYRAQGSATPAKMGLAGLLQRLLPIGTAAAQVPTPTSCQVAQGIFVNCVDEDVLLRIEYPSTNGFTPGEYVAYQAMAANQTDGGGSAGIMLNFNSPVWTCNDIECAIYMPFTDFAGEATHDLLVITGTEDNTEHTPAKTDRLICAAQSVKAPHLGSSTSAIQIGETGYYLTPSGLIRTSYEGLVPSFASCRTEEAFRYGAPTISIDLGGDDKWNMPVGMVHTNATIPVSIHLDVDGMDAYGDLSDQYDSWSPMILALGDLAGHPSVGSAMFGGVAVAIDARGDDDYVQISRSQGFGRVGFGMLADLSGTDNYEGGIFMQGASSETFSLGGGILFDVGGSDDYIARSGQGYGLGGILLDVGGKDTYINEAELLGVPVVHLDIIPGGDVTSLDERGDNRIWTSGPGSINAGLGIDQEIVIAQGQGDNDGFPDLVEFIVGTDPKSTSDSPITNPTARAGIVREDTDGDGYPDYIERAFSTDPESGSSYPAGLPRNPVIHLPDVVVDALDSNGLADLIGIDEDGAIDPLGNDNATGDNFTSSDKIVDLRVPLQNAGSIDMACTGEFYPNSTAPYAIPGTNASSGANVFQISPGVLGARDPQTNGPAQNGGKVDERCVHVSYTSTGQGDGNATIPDDDGDREDFTFHFPQGILAIGDLVSTRYADDYLVAIDLGGNDTFTNAAGGGLLLTTRPRLEEGEILAEHTTVYNTFIAPSIAVSVDMPDQGALLAPRSNDKYDAKERDFAQGALFGVLVDTSGADAYIARDGSQGSLGGVLLDLGGVDTFSARHLSQGAGLASAPRRSDMSDTPTTEVPNDQIALDQGSTGIVRRDLPGILLDLSGPAALAAGNVFTTSGSNSQGFARGFSQHSAETNSKALGNATRTYGILASLGEGTDIYQAATGRNVQGVGGLDGVGMLVDRAGVDSYRSGHFISQGATISQTVGSRDFRYSEHVPRPAAGILVDLSGSDTYTTAGSTLTGPARADRQNNLTVTHAETAFGTASPNGDARLYLDTGVHLDIEATNAFAALNGIAGGQAIGGELDDFHVHLPTARLAIGKDTPTRYTREYAFVVDLGGDNRYTYNQGGHIRDYVGELNSTPGNTNVGLAEQNAAPLNLFPLSFLLDAGTGSSTYNATGSFAQGASYFGIGMLIDLGGRDALRVDDVRVPSIGSEWVDVPPVIDGTIGDDWNNVTNKTITLVAQDDARFASNWSLRIANDKRAVYVALEGKTSSNSTAERLRDRLFVDFDMGDEGRQYINQSSTGGLNRTGVDQVNFSYEVLGEGRYRCVGWDSAAAEGSPTFILDPSANRSPIRIGETTLFESACRFNEDGSVVYEFRKEIINPYDDPFDLDYCYVLPDQGFGVRRADGECDLGKDRMGLMIQFNDTGAGWLGGTGTSGNVPPVAAPFVYPASSQREDGEYGGQQNGRLDDEMTRWATVTLANLADKVAPNVTRPSTHMQGASLAGVGVVALLGNANSENELTASDRSQGYGEYSGLGLLFDVGGSDRYIGGTRVQGAAHALGAGVLADLEGNDNYRSTGQSLGWSGGLPAGRGVEGSIATAVFLDLGGDDQYVGRPDFKPYAPGAKEGQLDQLSSASTTTDNSISYQRPDAGNNVIWIQNGSVGADYKITEVIRGQIAGKLAQSLYGSNDQRTKLIVTRHQGNYTELPPAERGPWGNGCTAEEVPKTSFDPEHDRLFDFVANGTVCFIAIVDTSVDTAQNAANTVERNVPDLPAPGDPVEAQIRALLRASGANPTQGTLSVRAVDFLVDRERVTTTRAKADLSPTITAWAQPVDLTSFQDGARRVKAMPQFIAELEGHGAFVMYDDVQDSLNDDYPAIRTLYIDNKPVVDVDLAPRYRGAANATYSPFSVNKEVDGLRVGYSVSRDSREDRLKAATGWDASPWNATIPCSRVPLEDYSRAQMCRQIAFYLPVDGNAALTTNSGTDPMVQRPSADGVSVPTTPVGNGPYGGPKSIVPERYDNPYGRKTVTLLDEFAISLEESFHLYLAGRESISTQGTTTRIRMSIERPDTTPATTEDGVSTWYLADVTRYANPDVPADPNSVFKVLSGAWDDAYETIQDNTGGGDGGDNILVTPLNDTYHDPRVQGCGQPNPRNTPCEILHGNATLTNTYPLCGPEPSTTVPKLVRSAFQTVNGALMSAGVSVCTNLWPTINATAEQYGDLNVVGDVGDTIEPTLETVDKEIDDLLFTDDGEEPTGTRKTDLNFRDFYFEANTTLPGPTDRAAGVRHDPATNSIIIPRGYKLVFSVESRSASGGGGIAFPPPDGEETVGQAITRIFNGLGDLVQQQIEGTPVEQIGQDLGAGSLAKFVADEVRRPGQNGPNVDQLTKGLGAGPSGYFLAGAGEADLQSRLEIRSPTEPSTNVTVRIQKGIQRTTVAQLVPEPGESTYAIEGDVGYGGATRHVNLTMTCHVDKDTGKIVPGGIHACNPQIWNSTWWTIHYPDEKPRVNWSSAWMPREGERWTQHNVTLDDNILADGLYAVNVSAIDATGKVNWSTDTLLVDRTMPRAWISTSPTIGTGGLVESKVPLRWKVAETGSGVDKVYVFYKGGDTLSSNINQWSKPAGSPFEPSVASALIASGSQSVFLAMAIGVDEAGNVEGVTDAINEADAVEKAFKAKIKSGLRSDTNPFGVARIFIDTKDPLFSSVHSEGGRLLTYKGAEFRFVRAGAPISFSICARDDESGVNSARLALDRIDPLTGEIVTETIEAVAGDGCDTGGTLYTASSWPARNTDRTAFPEGVWIASFEVFDQGGNRLRLPFEQVILDHASPDVVVQPPVLPVGQTAVKPGDLVKIRFLAEDAFGVDEAAMRVDASSLAKNATAIPTRTVRVEGTIYHEASFTVDRADLSNSAYTIIVKVPDLAGNITLANTTIKVDFKPFDFVPGTLRVSNVTHNGATLHWKTTENTSALAKYGTSLVSLTGRTPQDLNATLEHDFRVEGLKPSTHYYLRAVSVSAGGFTKESEIIEINTTSALFLDVLSPVKNDKVSGSVKVAFKGGLLDSTDFVTYTLEVRDGPTKPWTFVTTAVRQGDVHNLTWNSTRYLDGVGYELRLTAEAGRDITTRSIGPITSDNTPPNVLVLSPLLATNDTTPNITAETVDTLAGLTPTGNPIRLLLDGVPVNVTPTLERTTGGRIRVHYEPTDAIPAGIHAFELQVTDLAGNVAKEIWRVAIDGDAPIVTLNPTRFAPGSAAAKLGGTVTLNLTIKDLSGVSHVAADTSSLSVTQPETRLVKLVNTDNWQGTFRVTDAAASAVRDVTIRATDLAGNTATFRVPITLDNVAPTVAATSIAATGHRRIEIDVPANEPILVNGTARAPNTEPGTAATTTAAKTAKLVFDGLFPSRTYTYTLNVVDLAGNEVPLTGKARTLDDTTPPSAIGALTYVDLLNGTLRLSWAAATDDVLVSHYQVYRSEDGITFAPHATTPTPTFEDWGLPYEKSYVYKVAAVDYGGNVGPADEKLRAAATAVPHLTVGLVTPTVGTTTTTFRYTVTYASPGGVPPAYVRVILDGVPQNMTLESGEPKTGAVYVYETRLAPHKRDAPHTYAYETSDGRYTIRFPEDGSLIRGPLVSGDILADGEAGGFAAFAQRVPLGGVAGIALAMLAAVGVAALIQRRKKEGSK